MPLAGSQKMDGYPPAEAVICMAGVIQCIIKTQQILLVIKNLPE